MAVGRGPVRTGVTVALPHDGAVGSEPVLAGTLTMTGRDGYTFHALPHDRLTEVMDRYGRVRRPAG